MGFANRPRGGWPSRISPEVGVKKEASAVAGEASSCLRAQVGAGPKTKGVVDFESGRAGLCHVPAARTTTYFFLVVDFLAAGFLPAGFLAAAFFVAMALVPPFYAAQSRER